MPVCDEYDINMCVHPDDPPLQILGLPRIVTCDADIKAFLDAVPNPHNGLTFCAGSLSAGAHNDVPELAKKYADRTHFVHARICNVMPNGDFKESTHPDARRPRSADARRRKNGLQRRLFFPRPNARPRDGLGHHGDNQCRKGLLIKTTIQNII